MFCSKCGKEVKEGKDICAKCENTSSQGTQEKYHTPSLVLSIVGLVFAILLPIVTYITIIIALVLTNKNKDAYKTKAVYIMSYIALAIAIVNSIAGVIIQLGQV